MALSVERLFRGIAASGIGLLLVSSILLPSTATFGWAQASPCVGTLAEGCLLTLDNPVSAVLSPDGGHYWLLTVPGTGILHTDLSDLGADYRLYLYGPDRALVGLSDNPGDSAESIEIPGAAPGLYVVIVDSPQSEFSDQPYLLAANLESVAGPPGTDDEEAAPTPPPPPIPISAIVAPLLPFDVPRTMVEPSAEAGPTRTPVIPPTSIPPTRTPTPASNTAGSGNPPTSVPTNTSAVIPPTATQTPIVHATATLKVATLVPTLPPTSTIVVALPPLPPPTKTPTPAPKPTSFILYPIFYTPITCTYCLY